MNQIYRLVRKIRLALLAPALAAAICALALPAHGQEITLLDLQNVQSEPYTFYTFNFTADLAQTYLTFQFRQDPAFWSLDDVSVTPIAGSTQLIANGDFSGGSVVNNSMQNVPNSWTLIGQVGLPSGGSVTSGCGTTGGYCWFDGSVGGVDGLFQSFATTIGSSYTLTFWLANSGGPTNEAVVQAGASEDVGGVLVPPPVLTNIIAAGSPYLAAGLGTTLNPIFDGGTLQLDSSGPTFSQAFTVNSTNGTIDTTGLTSTMSGVLSGPGGLTFMNSGSGGNGGNAGSLTLTNTDTYQGASTIDTGTTLKLSGTGSIADSSGVVVNGAFDISGTNSGAWIQSLSGNGTVALGAQSLTLTNADGSFAGVIGGSGGFAVTGGIETLSGINTYTGATTIGSGATLALSGVGSITDSSGVVDNGNFSIAGVNAGIGTYIQSLSGNGAVALGANTLQLINANGTFAGIIGGTGGFVIAGGMETLTGNSVYTGQTTISSGAVLALSGTGSIADSSVVSDFGTFNISGTNAGAWIQGLSGIGTVVLGPENLTLTNADETFGGVIGGSGAVAITGGVETLNGTNTYTGATSIGTGATLALYGTGSIANSSGVADDGSFDISATSAGASVQSLSGNGTVALGSQMLTLTNANSTFAGAIGGSGGLAVDGGTQTLAGTNTYSGGTAIGTGATLALSGTGSMSDSSGVADGGTLNISGTNSGAWIQSLSGNGTVALGAENLTLTNAGNTFAGVIGGNGGIAVTGGAETLSGTNTYTGATAIGNGATLALNGAGSITDSSGVADSGTFDISGTSAGASVQSLSGNGAVALGAQNLTLANASGVFSGTIDGTGGVAITGGLETFSGSNGYSGGTTVSGGGVLLVGADASLGAATGALALNNGTLLTTASFVTTRDISLAGVGTMDVNAGADLTDSTGALSGTGALVKTGGGTLSLCGGVSNSGGTSVVAGALDLCGNDTATGSTSIASGATIALSGTGSLASSSGVADNGTLDISGANAGASVQSLSGNGTVALGAELLTLTNANDTFAGTIGGSGGLAVSAGTETLSGSNSYAGGTSISNGARLALSGTGSVANSSGVTDNGYFDISASSAGASVQSLSGNGAVALGSEMLTLTNANGSFAGAIGGSGGLAVGAGTETLNGTNTYSGGTVIGNGATLALSGAGSIANSSGIADNGRFDISGTSAGASVQSLSGNGAVALGAQTLTLTNANSTFAGAIGGGGGIAVNAGTETLNGTNTYTGSTAIGSGATLALSGTGNIASSSGVADNGTFDISGASAGAAAQSLSGNGVVALGAQTLTLTNASGLFSGAIGGTGAIALTGGTETLSGTDAYSGGTAVSGGGTLVVATDSALGAAGGALTLNNGTLLTTASFVTARDISLAGSGTLDVGGGTDLTDSTGTISGAGALIKSGDGTLALCGTVSNGGGVSVTAGALNLCGTDTGSGALSIASGATLALSGSGSIANASGVADNGTLDISAANSGASVQSLSGNGTVALGAQLLTLTNANGAFAGAIGGSGGLALTLGTETLSGTNSYTGGTAIGTGATLALSGTGSIANSSGIADNGTFDISGTSAGASVQSLSGNGAVALGAQLLTLTNASSTFAGIVGGTGGVALTGGTETLGGVNTYSGGTAVSGGGTLAIAADSALGAAGGALTLNNGTLLTTASFVISRNVSLAGPGTIDVSAGTALTDSAGTISGPGALIKSGSGTLSLCGGISNSGGVSATAGSLNLCGVDAGTGSTSIAPGATLALTGAGSIANSSGIADNGTFDISGAGAGSSVQSLSGNGTVALGAQTLTLTNAQGTFAGVAGGTGGIAVSGGVETLSGTNTYTGSTSVSGGARILVAADAALGNAAGGLTLNNGTLEATASFTTARNLNLLGGATFDTDPGVALTQTGQISGNGHVTKVGDGTLILAGDNDNWGQQGNNSVGGITINDGLVEVTNPYGLGYGLVTLNSGVIATTVNIMTGQTILIGGDTVLNTDAGTTTTLTGTVETDGTGACFQKTGLGTLIVSGVTTLSNGTCLEDGRIEANGTLNSTVNVYPGAVLRGTGTITGAVLVRGTLAPGNSPGTLTTTASVTMAPGSTFQEDINGTGTGTGPGNYSRLLVTGPNSQFIASGATLNVNLQNITGTVPYTPYVPALGNSFNIVSAAGGIVGQFAAFDQPVGLATGTRFAIFYDALGSNSIDLRVVPTSYAGYLQDVGANANAQSAGGALDQILAADQTSRATPAQVQIAYAVSGLTATALPGIVTALAGEVYADLAAAAPQADQWLQRSVARQLDVGDGVDSREHQPGDALWLDSTVNRGKWSEDSESSGFNADRTQIDFGFDLLLGQPNRLGFGFSHSLTNVATAAGDGSIEENMGFIYGQYSLSRLLIDGMFGAGDSHWDASRPDPLNLSPNYLAANAHGNDSLASLGVRWPWHISSLVLAPYVRELWQRTARDGFNEGSTPDALSGPGYAARGMRSTVGISGGSESQSPLGSALTYQFNLGVARDSAALVQSVVQESLTGAALETQTPEVGRAFVLASVTGTARLAKRTYAYVGVSDEARRGKSEDAGFTAGFRTRF